jgi:hypothetical protein
MAEMTVMADLVPMAAATWQAQRSDAKLGKIGCFTF